MGAWNTLRYNLVGVLQVDTAHDRSQPAALSRTGGPPPWTAACWTISASWSTKANLTRYEAMISYLLLCCVTGTGGRWGSGSTAWTRPSSPSSPWRRAATRASSSSGWSRGPSWRSWADPHTRTNKYIYNLIYAYLLSSKYILLALLLINCICLRRSVTLISLSLEMLRWRREVTV